MASFEGERDVDTAYSGGLHIWGPSACPSRRATSRIGALLPLALLLACLPASPKNHTFEGPGLKLRQTVIGRSTTLELLDAQGAVKWKVADNGVFEPVFSPDGRYVAEPSEVRDASVRVFGPDGKVTVYEPLTLASADEISLMAQTSCGIAWYGGMSFGQNTELVVLLNQAPPRPPIYAPDPTPKLEILIDVSSGKMSRRTPARVVTVEGLIATYRSKPEAQLEAAQGLVRKSQQEGGEKLSQLTRFARDELPKTKDAHVQAALLRVLERTGSDADRKWVGTQALEAGWPPDEVLMILQRLKDKREPLRAYSQAVLSQRLGDVNVRAQAVRVLAKEPGGIQAIQAGLADPESDVRDASEDAMRSLPATGETFAFLIEHAEAMQARRALVELFVQRSYKGPPNPGVARFEKACDTRLQEKWPGCEAWTGAMADARGQTSVAKSRYQHALAGVTAELARSPMASSEMETFFRLHVRLAVLARGEKKTVEVTAHVEALKASTWWDQFRVDCSSGLPRTFDVKCDGGAYRELLISQLEGKPPPR